jgi:hypothetical protein
LRGGKARKEMGRREREGEGEGGREEEGSGFQERANFVNNARAWARVFCENKRQARLLTTDRL